MGAALPARRDSSCIAGLPETAAAAAAFVQASSNFGWAAANHTQRPRISLTTGVFTGYAWSQNTGWINLGSVQTTSIQLTDNDGDGEPAKPSSPNQQSSE